MSPLISKRSLPYNPNLKERSRRMRNDQTPMERKLWSRFLRGLPVQFYRQKPLNHYIVDFYCAKKKLVIEVDGDSHFTPEAREADALRTSVLESYGLRVVRFTNHEVRANFESVCERILRAIG